MCSNKLEYSTATGSYCTMHVVKVPFCMPEFSISKIIFHRFYVYNEKVKSGIDYNIIIGRYLMVQQGLSSEFKHQFLQWDGVTVPMK